MTAVRELIPPERISEALIREVISSHDELCRWSRAAPRAIRPRRLASIIRRRIWHAHGVTIQAVQALLSPRKPGESVAYRIQLVVDLGGKEVELVSRTRFTRRPNGRVTAHIDLTIDGRAGRPITASPILLLNASPGD